MTFKPQETDQKAIATLHSHWPNRDRFVLSNGHACILQYMMLVLLGYNLSVEDLKHFRQLNSLTPGHPEAGHTDGIEVTTGPLGQGFANSVGLAIAQKHAAAEFNRDGFELFNSKTYVVLGDGCMMEGVASEAASLAGHLRLDNLIAFYDDNKISIDGDVSCAFTENVPDRFRSYEWNVLEVKDGDKDLQSIYDVLVKAKECKDKPTLISIRTTIGFGSREQGTHSTHGSPLKDDDIRQVKEKFGFNPDEKFVIPQEVADAYHKYGEQGGKIHEEWNKLLESYGEKYPKEKAEIERRAAHKLPQGWEKALPTFTADDKEAATRKLSEGVLSKVSAVLPELLGGSADLTGSNLTRWSDATDFQPPATHLGDWKGRYIRYGVREHAMGAIMNGIHAFGLHIPTAGTFLNFVSYAIGAVRLSALSKFQVIWVATHDSIGLGEDGPTHQPIETAAALRAIPNLDFWRPADGNEVSGAYKVAIESFDKPSVIALTRQGLPQLENSSIENTIRGGYVLVDQDKADLTLVSTGSEVAICRDAAKILKDSGIKARVVSMPCFSVFDAQPLEYREKVLPNGAPILSVEAYSTFGWGKYSHVHHGINRFGVSATAADAYKYFQMTPEDIAKKSSDVVKYFKKFDSSLESPLVVESKFLQNIQ